MMKNYFELRKLSLQYIVIASHFVFLSCNTYKSFQIVEEPETWLETITDEQLITECHVMIYTDQVKIKIENEYYWYDKNRIKVTKGYIGGRLLHGETKIYDRRHQLIEKQEYKMGQKHGIWVEMHKNGKTKKISSWNEGKLDGKMYEYDVDGVLSSETNYNNGELTKFNENTDLKKSSTDSTSNNKSKKK